jgi:hypothetical protein
MTNTEMRKWAMDTEAREGEETTEGGRHRQKQKMETARKGLGRGR